MGKINSRAKGAAAERELVNHLAPLLGGVTLKRNLEQTRVGGHDLVGLDQWAIEVKRYATATESDVARWWAQAVEQAGRVERTPALAYRLDHRSWRFRLPISHLHDTIAGDQSLALDWTMEVGLDAFAALVRETIGCVESSERAVPA